MLHHSSSSSLVVGQGAYLDGAPEPQMQNQGQRPHQLPLNSSLSEVNGVGGPAVEVVQQVKKWNPFEDSFTQMPEDHVFGEEFDKIREQGSQSSEFQRLLLLLSAFFKDNAFFFLGLSKPAVNNISPGSQQTQPLTNVNVQDVHVPKGGPVTVPCPEDDPFGSAPFSMPPAMLLSGGAATRKAAGGND